MLPLSTTKIVKKIALSWVASRHLLMPASVHPYTLLYTRNHFISNLVQDSLKFKTVLELNVFYKKPLYKQPSTRQP